MGMQPTCNSKFMKLLEFRHVLTKNVLFFFLPFKILLMDESCSSLDPISPDGIAPDFALVLL